MKLGEAVYGAPSRRGSAAMPRAARAEPKRSGAGDNVVDADFEEVKDDKKKSA